MNSLPLKEIEMKLKPAQPVDPDVLQDCLRQLGCRIRAVKTHTIQDRFFDTDDWWLYRAGCALRLRNKDGDAALCIKSLGPIRNGLAQRWEAEQAIPEQFANTKSLKQIPQVEALMPFCHRFSFHPLFQYKNQRTAMEIETPHHARILLCLDRVALRVKRKTITEWELELELIDGQKSDLHNLAEHMQTKFELKPSTVSKFGMGIQAFGLQLPDIPLQTDWPIGFDDTLRSFIIKTLCKSFVDMRWNEPGARVGIDPEYLHDMRVAIRRIRAGLKIFAPFFDPAWLEEIKNDFKHIAHSMGMVRDLDVLIQSITTKRRKMKDQYRATTDVFLQWLLEKREQARQTLFRELDGFIYRRLPLTFEQALLDGDVFWESLELDTPVRLIAPDWIRRQWKKTAEHGKRLRTTTKDVKFHAFRIRCKKMRYRLEFFQPVIDFPLKKSILRVKAMQDILGVMQDNAVARSWLDRFHMECPKQLSSKVDLKTLSYFKRYWRKKIQKCRDKFFRMWRKQLKKGIPLPK